MQLRADSLASTHAIAAALAALARPGDVIGTHFFSPANVMKLCEVARVEGPERIAPEWWRERGTARLRDYYRVEDALGRRYWIYRSGVAGDGRGGSPEWFMQGLFG